MDLSVFFPVWDKLSDNERSAIEASAVKRTFRKGSVLHAGSGECTGLILVSSGQLRAYTVSPEGKEITLYRLLDMDICLFSASCMISGIGFTVMLSAEKDSEVVIIPADVYKKLMQNSAILAGFTNELMASRFSDVMWLVEQIMWKSFDKRLSAFLLEESNIEDSLSLRITHEVIGNHLGSPREVVTRMLKYFADEGLVSLSRGTVTLSDPERLRELAED